MKTKLSFLCLSYKGHGCNTVPLGTVVVASYVLKRFNDKFELSIFEDPNEFADYLDKNDIKIVCFSNYIWNCNLSYEFARRIKENVSDAVIIFGGPNYPLERKDQYHFLSTHNTVDFYIYGEGEQGIVELLSVLLDYEFNILKVKDRCLPIPGCHYLSGQNLITGETLPRFENLDEIPSPYLTGMCDNFLSTGSVPLIQTARGCPFSCTFCQLGHIYYNKIKRYSALRIRQEMEYIAKRTNVPNLILADSNFGMYKADLEVCKEIAIVQKKYNWPHYFLGIGGKNNKERVLKAASLIKGSYLSAAVQSTALNVLKNIKRENVSWNQMVKVAKDGEKHGSNSFSEVILCLPGDTIDAHYKSICELIDAGIRIVRSHQFVLLSSSEASTKGSREKYEMVTGFRVVPKTISTYELFGSSFYAYEIDEICIANKTMSFDDYLNCRSFNLTVEIFYNDGVFVELINLLKSYKISISPFIRMVHNMVKSSTSSLKKIYENFLKETRELYKSCHEIEVAMNNPDILMSYLDGEMGNNEQLIYRAVAIFNHMEEMHEIAVNATVQLLKKNGIYDEGIFDCLKELSEFSLFRKKKLFSTDDFITKEFHYDFISLLNTKFKEKISMHYRPNGFKIIFLHNKEQKDLIFKYLNIFGTSNYGLGNILSNAANVSHLYREARAA